ncbi:hypothetical protein O0Q50_22260 [Priestia aryabhattai]|uniref:Uncharacterized protein n=1 Tax=Priestia aryabhattai TaxID=412384 RepID=A0AAX6NDD9_PRIAR|nr:hypothetical protein [Priestia aryabhattai]MDU9693908.1 hypothetical protein [Priestia aryabhattai]
MPENTNENTVIKRKGRPTYFSGEDTITNEIKAQLNTELFKHKDDFIQAHHLLEVADSFISENYCFFVSRILQEETQANWFQENISRIEGVDLGFLVLQHFKETEGYIQSFIKNFMKDHVESVKEIFLTSLAFEKLQKEWKDRESYQHTLKIFRILNSTLKDEQTVTIVKRDGSKVTVPKTLQISHKEISIGTPTEYVIVDDIKGYKLKSGLYLLLYI